MAPHAGPRIEDDVVQFFPDKVAMPNGGRMISRPRLVQMFTDAVDARLVVVSAPEGSARPQRSLTG